MDERLLDAFRVDGALAEVAEFVTSFGVVGLLLPVAVIAGAWVWRAARSWTFALAPLASTWITAVTTAWMKDAVGRARPSGAEQFLGALSPAFPSGHASNTTAFVVAAALVTGAIRPRIRRRLMWSAVAVAGVMGWTRLALGVHWVSDVVAGWVLGALVAVVTVRAARALARTA